MIPGEFLLADGEIALNAGRDTLTLEVANSGDRPVQVGSHYHFFEVNPALGDKPETVNESPTEKGWFCVLEIKDGAEIAGLMDEAAYKAYCETL